jgi:hypothetical protein
VQQEFVQFGIGRFVAEHTADGAYRPTVSDLEHRYPERVVGHAAQPPPSKPDDSEKE